MTVMAAYMQCFSMLHCRMFQVSSIGDSIISPIVIIIVMCIFVHVSFQNGTVYLPRDTVILVMALAYAYPAGSVVLLGNLYTAVWEGHVFCTFGVDLVTYVIWEGFEGGLGGKGKTFV